MGHPGNAHGCASINHASKVFISLSVPCYQSQLNHRAVIMSFLWVKIIDNPSSKSVVGKKVFSFQTLNSCLWGAEDRNISAKINEFSTKNKEVEAEIFGSWNIVYVFCLWKSNFPSFIHIVYHYNIYTYNVHKKQFTFQILHAHSCISLSYFDRNDSTELELHYIFS